MPQREAEPPRSGTASRRSGTRPMAEAWRLADHRSCTKPGRKEPRSGSPPMAVQQALEPAFVHAISAADPDRRRLTRTAVFAIAVSVAADVAEGLYVYEAKYGAPTAPLPA